MVFSRGVFLAVASVSAGALYGQTLALVSGHGLVVQEQQIASTPFRVRAVDAAGRPLAGVPITWALSPSSAGTLIAPASQTNENGEATSSFFASSNQPGQSYLAATLTASSPHGVVPMAFVVTQSRSPQGNVIALPFVQPRSPVQGATLEGASGTILPGAVRVEVVAQGGVDLGKGVPNVGLRVESRDETQEGPTVRCNAPAGIVITDQNGIATCDLVLSGPPGLVRLQAVVGEYSRNFNFDVRVTEGTNCAFTVAPLAPSVSANAGTSVLNVNAAPGCQWNAASAVPWITISGGASGQGNGTVTFTFGANTGPQRSGTIAVAGQQVTVTQAAAGSTGPTPLSFTTAPALPGATTNLGYSIGLGVTGGIPPYRWSATGSLPPGLALNATSGVISGVPTAAGTYAIPVTVADSSNIAVSQNFTLVVSQGSVGSPTLIFTTSSFAVATVGVAYQAPVNTVGGCSNPFSGGPAITLASGSLPPGLSVQSLGSGYAIVGTPTVRGEYAFALRATACNDSTVRGFTINVSSPASDPMTASVSELAFVSTAGAVTRPANQTVSISTFSGVLNFGASASTESGGDWLTVTPATGQTPADLTVGIGNTAAFAPGTYRGAITIMSQASNSPVVIPVRLSVNAAATLTALPDAIRFDHLPGAGSISEQPLAISSAMTTPFNIAVNSGATWLTASPATGVTPSNIRLTANSTGLAPGVYSAHVEIMPFANPGGGKVVPVTLTVGGPTLTPIISSVTNGASFLPGPIAPGEIVTIFGTNLTSTAPATLRLNALGALENTLAETRVLFGGAPAPLIYVSATQISFIAPYGLSGNIARIEVEHKGVRSAVADVPVVDAAPGIFRLDATAQGAIVNQDGSINGSQNAAPAGSIISVYATGEGLLTPRPVDGTVASGSNLPMPQLPVGAEIGGISAEIFYAGPAPGQLFGLMQVNARIPANVAAGNSVPVILTVGARRSSPATVAVR